jgi:hypothetical protein
VGAEAERDTPGFEFDDLAVTTNTSLGANSLAAAAATAAGTLDCAKTFDRDALESMLAGTRTERTTVSAVMTNAAKANAARGVADLYAFMTVS